jgi:hypothetical protein
MNKQTAAVISFRSVFVLKNNEQQNQTQHNKRRHASMSVYEQ